MNLTSEVPQAISFTQKDIAAQRIWGADDNTSARTHSLHLTSTPSLRTGPNEHLATPDRKTRSDVRQTEFSHLGLAVSGWQDPTLRRLDPSRTSSEIHCGNDTATGRTNGTRNSLAERGGLRGEKPVTRLSPYQPTTCTLAQFKADFDAS
jgi:hypothetical protein